MGSWKLEYWRDYSSKFEKIDYNYRELQKKYFCRACMTDEENANQEDLELDETSEVIEAKETPEQSDSEEIEEEHEEKELTLEQKFEQLEEKLTKSESEIGYRDAEIINIRKKMNAEKSSLIRYSGFNLSRRILGVLDDVDRALTMIDDENKSPEAEGLRLIRTKLWQQLSLDGVSHIDAINSDFDPNLHEAITTVPPTEEFPSGRIVQVLEEGYMYKDKLLKASKVVVSS
ncbi:MAG: nucleotide exchange factor GrpE [Methanobacteriota archaeon]|nr:MAG: nucleotide exchange factor GrpE [Euryarchaeota archaeon]